MSYRLLALDLDGTLLREDLSVTPRVRRALELAQRQGVRLTLASGRAFTSMRRWVEDLGLTTPVICYQGAMVTDPCTQRRVQNHTFPTSLVGELSAFAWERRLSLTLYAEDAIYVAHKLHSDEFYAKWFGLPYHVVDDLAMALPTEPTKFLLIGTGAELDRVTPEATQRFGERLQVVRSHELFLEGLALGVTKGSALAWLAQSLGIARAETMAIGDSGNDKEMLAWAGLGVAMGNASSEAKASADYIAPSVDEDGVAEAVERFCLGS
jgi:Cof subfamily protein (haloacid dehalogenase superfamily)